MKSVLSRVSAAAAVVITGAATIPGSPAASASSAAPVAAPAPASLPALAHGGRSHSRGVTIYLTRHGQTILNVLERAQGWTDSPLVNDAARAVPRAVGKNIAAREGKLDSAYAADMKRHLETAQLILKGMGSRGKTVHQDAGLRELAFGTFEGGPARASWLAILHQLGYSVDEDAAPNAPADADGQNGGWQTMEGIAMAQHGVDGTMAALKTVAGRPTESGIALPAEDCSDANARLSASLNRIARDASRNHHKRVLVVSSGLSISCYLTDSLNTPTTGISNVGVSKLQYTNGKWTVLSVNDKSYQQ